MQPAQSPAGDPDSGPDPAVPGHQFSSCLSLAL
jgi:hypothetical protein